MKSISEVYLENVTKIYKTRFGSVKALDNVSFKVNKGEYFTVVGPSGSGKSTILKIIAGLMTPDIGKVYIDGEDVTFKPPKERNIGMLFQSYALYPHMTVYENIAFPLKIKKITREEIDYKVKAVAEMLRIDNLLHKKPAEISGGEAQRVALARALIKEPKVLLLDEPLSNIDILLRSQIRAELKALQRRLNITVIHVTHDQVEAFSLGDRVMILKAGMVMQIGAFQEIYFRPKNIFVATFIGNPPMNIIEGRISRYDKGCYFVSIDGIIKVPLPCKESLSKLEDMSVFIGIRPETINLAPCMGSSNKEKLAVQVLNIEPLGANSIVHLKIGDNPIKVLISMLQLREVYGQKQLCIEFDPTNIYLFDEKGNIISL